MSFAFATECPICMDTFYEEKNTMITECGHKFHANCLMKHVSHNGFGCPYCRTKMIKNSEDDNEAEDDDDGEEYFRRLMGRGIHIMPLPPARSDPLNEGMIMEAEEEDPIMNDYILNGFRWFNQRVNGEELDNDDEYGEGYEDEDEEETATNPNPNTAYITRQLISNGLNMEDLVKVMLYESTLIIPAFGNETETYDELTHRVYGMIRHILAESTQDHMM